MPASGEGGIVDFLLIDQTISLPPDYLAAKHGYWVKVNRNQVWFGIDNRIRAFALTTNSQTERILLANNTKPYSILITNFTIPASMHPLIELIARKDGKYPGAEIEVGWGDIRWSEGDPQPPLALPIYIENTDAVFAGHSVSGGSLTSHPIPVYGYNKVELLFEASADFTAEVQYLGLSGAWRTYDIFSSPAGSRRLRILLDEPLILARVILTPATYPLTINEAFAVMIP